MQRLLAAALAILLAGALSLACDGSPPATSALCAALPPPPPPPEPGHCGEDLPPPSPPPDCPARPNYGAGPDFDAPSALVERDLSPYFQDTRGEEARESFRRGRYAEAASRFDAIADANGPEARPAAYMEAVALLYGGREEEARDRFLALEGTYPILADHALALAADAARRAGRYEQSVELARRVPRGSASSARAAVTEARALRALGNAKEAESVLRDFIATSGPNPEVQLLLADTLGAAGKKDEATSAYLVIDALWPLSATANQAMRRLAQLLHVKPAATPHEPVSRWAGRLLSRGRQLYNAHRSTSAIAKLDKALSRLPIGSRARCEAQLLVARSYDKLRDRDRGAAYYQSAARECDGTDLMPDILFFGGRSLFREGLHSLALQFFDKLHGDHPDETTNDDALIYEAHIHEELNDDEGRTRALERILRDYPDGDMRDEAVFLLVWDPYRKGDLEGAVAAADRALTAVARETTYYSRGRTLYWKARALSGLGRQQAALETYRDVLRLYPLSYYAQLAYARIAERAAERGARTELERVVTADPGPGPGIGGRLAPGVFESTPFLQAAELARMGLFDGAQRALSTLEPDDPDDVEWMLALLADRVGSFPLSHNIARRDHPDFKHSYPKGTHAERWRIAYPRPFERQVATRSAEAGIEPALAWSIMREESGFNTRIESWANALGLMQLLLPTAKWLAREEDGVLDREAVLQPDLNIRLGTRFLGNLLTRLGHPALAIAGYNAGESAVRGWLRERSSLALDEFVEEIPYRQTRRYVQRVLATLGTYAYLYGDDPLLLDLSLPHIPSLATQDN